MRRLNGLALLAAGGLILASLALALTAPRAEAEGADPRCVPLAALLDRLEARYGEAPVLLAVGPRGRILVTGAPDGSSWTVIEVVPDGVGCVRMEGEAWTALEVVAPRGEPL